MSTMPTEPYEIRNIKEFANAAPPEAADVTEIRFAHGQMELGQTGFTLHTIKPGKRQAIGHHHDQAEEVCVVLSGGGRVKLDDQIEELSTLDAVRISPQVMRSFEAGPEGMELLVFGQHFARDGGVVPGWWND